MNQYRRRGGRSMHAPFLATYVVAHGLRPEPIATGALAHLTQTSPTARHALETFLTTLCAGLPTNLDWRAEEVSPTDQGRPDLVGLDNSGARVILEAKFDANFTAAQLDTTYMQRLHAGQAGLL